ncbi:MAG: ABC transporter ATP-binding protein [Promethearchaeota archaeon]
MTERHYSRSFSSIKDISVILFASLTLFATAEMFGLIKSAVASFNYPISVIIPISMIFFGTLGFLGFLTDSKVNFLPALAAVIVELLILSTALVTNPEESYLIPTVTIQILLVLILISGIINIYHHQQQKVNEEYIFDSFRIKSTDLAIEIKNLRRTYDLSEGVKVNALQGVQLQIKKGDFIAVMGPSGSGKSTLLNCLGALDRPTEGKIYIDGIDISLLDDEGLAWLRNRKIGFIFQSYNLISRSTVGQNVEIPALVTPLDAKQRKQKTMKVLNDVGLGDKYYRNPNTLSGGEQQRVAIARALMNEPTILLADEPTGNLDSKSGAVVMEILQKLNNELGVTLVVVTHDPEVGSLADRIYYLKDGSNAGYKDNIKL